MKDPLRGVVFYVVITSLLSWASAWLLRTSRIDADGEFGSRLVACSLLYMMTMGWPPLLALWLVRRHVDGPGFLDHGFEWASTRFMFIAVLAPFALHIAAISVARLAMRLGISAGCSLDGELAWQHAFDVHSWPHGLALLMAFLVTASLLLLQSFAEELAWRGFFLVRMVQRWGHRKALWGHGLIWGVWYAPVLMMTGAGHHHALLLAAGFLITCGLLGVLLGWLRLASHSLAPPTVANAVLTGLAGLPFLLRGVDVGLRGSAYRPQGWLPIVAAIGVLALGKGCSQIVAPRQRPSGPAQGRSPRHHHQRWLH